AARHGIDGVVDERAARGQGRALLDVDVDVIAGGGHADRARQRRGRRRPGPGGGGGGGPPAPPTGPAAARRRPGRRGRRRPAGRGAWSWRVVTTAPWASGGTLALCRPSRARRTAAGGGPAPADGASRPTTAGVSPDDMAGNWSHRRWRSGGTGRWGRASSPAV